MCAVRFALVFLLPLPLAAQDSRAQFDPDRFTLIYGAFCQQQSVGEVPAPDTDAQKIDLLAGTPDIRWPTHIIPALPGISFGIRTEATDGTLYAPVTIEVTHPPFLKSGTTQQSYITELGGVGASINAYSFDLTEEMATGPWTFRAIHEGNLLYEVRFRVVPAQFAPNVGQGCGDAFVS